MNGNIVTRLMHRAKAHAGMQVAVIAAVLVLALAWMEPAGAAGPGFASGLAFHALHIGPASCVAWWCSGWLLRTREGSGGSPWPWLVLAGALAGPVLAPWSLWLEQLFGVFDDDAAHGNLSAALLHEWSQVVPLTALLWPAMNLLVVWRQTGPAGRPAASVATAASPQRQLDRVDGGALSDPPAPMQGEAGVPDCFLDRLPVALGRGLVWLQAQEHSISVTTVAGSHLLLQAFGPAVAQLERLGVEGMRVHRSAWVAWARVSDLDARARSPALVLRDGTRVAVGRRRLPEVARAWALRGPGGLPSSGATAAH